MWKRRFIAVVTFIAGLFYFLEFVLPASVPIGKITGVVESVGETSVTIVDENNKRQSVEITVDNVIMRHNVKKSEYGDWDIIKKEETSLYSLKRNDKVDIGRTTYLSRLMPTVNNLFIVLGAMAWGMGLISLFIVHSGNIRKRKPEWYASVFFFIAVLFGILAGIGYGTGSIRTTAEQIISAPVLVERLVKAQDPVSSYIISTADAESKRLLSLYNPSNPPSHLLKKVVAEVFNKVLDDPKFYSPERFSAYSLPFSVKNKIGKDMRGEELQKFNRELLQTVYEGSLSPSFSFMAELSNVVVNDLTNPMGGTVFSLLAFFMASAAYRAFKLRSRESIILMISAVIVMLGQIPFGMWLTAWLPPSLQLPSVCQWVLYIANTAAVRGLYFGIMVGAIAFGLRYWLSLERGAFFDREM